MAEPVSQIETDRDLRLFYPRGRSATLLLGWSPSALQVRC